MFVDDDVDEDDEVDENDEEVDHYLIHIYLSPEVSCV